MVEKEGWGKKFFGSGENRGSAGIENAFQKLAGRRSGNEYL
jgi:hypothetical protein